MVVEQNVTPFWQWLLPGDKSPGIAWLQSLIEQVFPAEFVKQLPDFGHIGALATFVLLVLMCLAVGLVLAYIKTSIYHGPSRAFVLTLKGFGEGVMDLLQTDFRKVSALAGLAFRESLRRRILVVFVVMAILMLLGGWFLTGNAQYPGRVYLSTVLGWSNFLSLIPILFLSTFSLPSDISSHTIYTITTKPVRSGEIVLGRIIGFVGIGTLLLVVMWGGGYLFVMRGLAHGHQVEGELIPRQQVTGGASSELFEGQTTLDTNHRHSVTVNSQGVGRTGVQAGHWHPVRRVGESYVVDSSQGQLQARAPIYGSLSFLDRNGTPTNKGINVGNIWTYRSYIDGGSPPKAAALWTFNDVTSANFPDPVLDDYKNQLERLTPGVLQRLTKLKEAQLTDAQRESLTLDQSNPAAMTPSQRRLARSARALLRVDYTEIAAQAPPANRDEAKEIARKAVSREETFGLPLEMTLRVFRTHKGTIEKAVRGQLVVRTIPIEGEGTLSSEPQVFYSREFIPDRKNIPRRIKMINPGGGVETLDLFDDVVRGPKRQLIIMIQCLDGGQLFGVAQPDLYIRAAEGSFEWNYTKGFISIWMQMTLVASFGVMFSTFLSGPIAWLATVSLGILGFFTDFVEKVFVSIQGGEEFANGPIESAIRMFLQLGVMLDLPDNPAITSIQFIDSIIIGLMLAAAQIFPNLGKFDVSAYVAYGYNIPFANVTCEQLLVTGAYVFGAACIGYFFLKTREIAA